MKLGECVDELRLELKVVVTNGSELDARWKRGSNRVEPILQRWYCAMCESGLALGDELFLVSLDVAGSLDQADMHS